MKTSIVVDRDLRIQIGPRPGDGLIATVKLTRVSAQDLADHLNSCVGRRAPAPNAECERSIDAVVVYETGAEREARAVAAHFQALEALDA